jgi:hypothetical protein
VAAQLGVGAGSADDRERTCVVAAGRRRLRELRVEQDRKGAAVVGARERLQEGESVVEDVAAPEGAAEGGPMAFMFELEREEGTPADPPSQARPYRCGAPATRSRWVAERSAWLTFETTTQTDLPCWWSNPRRPTRSPALAARRVRIELVCVALLDLAVLPVDQKL